MANLMTSFQTGVSGLHSAQASLNTASHNLANAQTKGYVRQQVLLSDAFYVKAMGPSDNVMMTGKGTVIQQTRQIRNEFLDVQYRTQNGRLGFYEKNKETALEIEDMLGELNGEQFQTAITELKEAISSLATDPGNVVYKDQVISVASQFIERAQVLQDDLNNYQTSLDTEIKQEVDQINDIVSKLKDLNQRIRKYEATGESANDYRDQRNKLLDDLSKIIDFDTHEERDGTITIYAQGQFLLDTSNQYRLTTVAIGKYDQFGQEYPVSDPRNRNPGSVLLKVKWENGGDFFAKDTLTYDSADHSDVGSLRGLLVARGGHAARYVDNNVGEKPVITDYTGAEAEMKAYKAAYEAYLIDVQTDPTAVEPELSDYPAAYEYQQDLNLYEDNLEAFNDYVDPSIVMTIQVQLDTLIHGLATMINDTLCPIKYATDNGQLNGNKIQYCMADGTPLADDIEDELGAKVRIFDYEHAFIGDDKEHTPGEEIFTRRGMTDKNDSTEISRWTKTDNYYLGDDGKAYPVWIYNEEITANPTLKSTESGGITDETITLQINGERATFTRSTLAEDLDKYHLKDTVTWDDLMEEWDYQSVNWQKSLYSISQLEINPNVSKDPSKIPTMYNEMSPQMGGYSSESILKIIENFDESMGTLDPNSQTEYDVTHYYSGIVGELATVTNVWNGIVENQELTVHSVDNERLDVMGVSSDEELSDLIKFQRCYDASSRYITVVDEMLEHLIERLGA